MIAELIKISEKVSQKNNIPSSAFEEIFKDSVKLAHLFTILRFGEKKSNQSTNNDIENSPKKRQLRR
jgi:hypothetical protein